MPKHAEGLETAEQHQQQKKEMDTLLCQAMEQLTLEERKKQQAILHGIDETVEDVTLLSRSLQDLDLQLKSIKHNSMYEVAERINAEYVHARAFRVMFLRANEYDAKASADQMLRFFESKYQLFGIEKLVEDITFADLNEEDIACLETGCIQIAGRDRSGRQVIVSFAGALERNLASWLRVLYFVKMKALEDEETQLRGIVSIWCALAGFKPSLSGKETTEAIKAAKALPQKRQAIHFCVDDMRQYVMCNVLIKLINCNMRVRLLVHYGSTMECQYQLTSYGIHQQSIPLDGNGRMNLDNHLNWIRSCCHIPDKLDSFSIPSESAKGITTPSPNDVLFAGVKIVNQLGNQRFHSLIQNYARLYDEEGKDAAKRQIVATIIGKIHESEGRFLERQQTDAGPLWKEVTQDVLRKKIMQAFRNRRSRKVDASKRKVDGNLIAGEPLPNDVIFGKAQRNLGTQLLHTLIREKMEEYDSLGRGLKMGLVEKIMKTINDEGGRFLVELDGEPDRWVELSHSNVRDRISKYFRNYRRPTRRK